MYQVLYLAFETGLTCRMSQVFWRIASPNRGKWLRSPLRRRNTRYKNPQLVAQHCFVASCGRCFPFFTVRNQLVAQQKHLLRVEESFCEK